MKKQSKRSAKRFMKLSIVLLSCISLITLIACGKKTNFTSVQDYVDAGGFIYTDVPQSATDIQYYLEESMLVHTSAISYVVSDEEEYDTFMESIKDDVLGVYEGSPYTHSPEWDNYAGENTTYTEEELEEMAYVEEHYSEMNYEEILSMTDHKFGFYDSYGAKVKDYTNMNYTLAEFPSSDIFKSVEEGSIENYTILYYYPTLTGSRTCGFIVDEENRKFIAFYRATIK